MTGVDVSAKRATTVALIQTIAEIDRGIELAIQETKAGRMLDARSILGVVRGLVAVQDALLSSHLKHDAIRGES